MPKFKMSEDVKKLNPRVVGETVSIPGEANEDKKYLFSDAWKKFAPVTAPLYQAEYPFNKPDSRHKFDFAFPAPHFLAVEVDGGEYMQNGGRHASRSDKVKMNLAAIAGYRVMHFSPGMLTDDPIGCVSQVLEALHADLGN